MSSSKSARVNGTFGCANRGVGNVVAALTGGVDSLYNPGRATCAQVIRWRKDGFPDFGDPVPDGAYQIPK